MSVWPALAVAIGMCGFLLASLRRYASVPRIAPGMGKTAPPDCMVVIPARNEAAVIARAVRSLPADTVIVVDDHSSDGTAEAARQAGAGVLPAPPLPRNGIGKANACAAGAFPLTSRWILFTDADTWFEEGFLTAAVAYAEANGLSLLSIYPRPEYETFAERALTPCARALFFCGPGRRNLAGLFSGQCLLVRREAYKFLGTHSAVVTQLIEDVKLTALAERHRLRFGIARAPELAHVHLYAGWSGIRAGVERHAFRFMLLNSRIGMSILAATLTLALWLPALAWLTMERHYAAAAVFALLPAALLRPWYGSWAAALLFPLGIYGMLPLMLRGVFSALTGRRLIWKGRTIGAK